MKIRHILKIKISKRHTIMIIIFKFEFNYIDILGKQIKIKINKIIKYLYK